MQFFCLCLKLSLSCLSVCLSYFIFRAWASEHGCHLFCNDTCRLRLHLCVCMWVCACVERVSSYLIWVWFCHLIEVVCMWFSVGFTYRLGNAQVYRRAFPSSSVSQCRAPRTTDSNQRSYRSEAPISAEALFALAVTQNYYWPQGWYCPFFGDFSCCFSYLICQADTGCRR